MEGGARGSPSILLLLPRTVDDDGYIVKALII